MVSRWPSRVMRRERLDVDVIGPRSILGIVSAMRWLCPAVNR